MPDLSKEYQARINMAFDYIETNLDQNFTLEELAQAASFSKFHFHRIFMAFVGETPFQFISRVRLERAASYLLSDPDEPIAEVAFRCGYGDISVFSRNFKSKFGINPTQYRKNKQVLSNLSQNESKPSQPKHETSMYICQRTNKIKWRTTMKLHQSTEVKHLEKMTLAYVRYIGPYKGDGKLFERLWNKLFTWAGPRGLIGGPDSKSLIIYHDDPNITDESKLRVSVCVTVPEDTKVDGEIGKMELESGDYVFARFNVNEKEFGQAWEWVYREWFPNSGYQPADGPCFEMYPEEPKDGRFTIDICVPVQPM